MHDLQDFCVNILRLERNILHLDDFPFSGSQRICIGKSFALVEMRLILGSMLQRLHPNVDPDYELKMKAELSLHPEGPLPIRVAFRES